MRCGRGEGQSGGYVKIGRVRREKIIAKGCFFAIINSYILTKPAVGRARPEGSGQRWESIKKYPI